MRFFSARSLAVLVACAALTLAASCAHRPATAPEAQPAAKAAAPEPAAPPPPPPAPAPEAAKKPAVPRPPETPVLAENTRAALDVPYGPDPKQTLDVYAPKGVSRAPVLIFVHGGEWARHDKNQVSYKPKFLNEHGIIFVSINYRLSPPAFHPDHVSDVASAISWVRRNIAEYGGAPGKIFIMGHSAGCHLVTLVSLDPRYLAAVGMEPGDLKGVIAWSGGAYDLVDKEGQKGFYSDFIHRAFGDKTEQWFDASPVNHVEDAKKLPPYLFIYIEPANNPSQQASERLAGLINKRGGNAALKFLPGRDHFNANHMLGAPGDTSGQVLLDFINSNSR